MEGFKRWCTTKNVMNLGLGMKATTVKNNLKV